MLHVPITSPELQACVANAMVENDIVFTCESINDGKACVGRKADSRHTWLQTAEYIVVQLKRFENNKDDMVASAAEVFVANIQKARA